VKDGAVPRGEEFEAREPAVGVGGDEKVGRAVA